jgi:hypothetical protein
MTNRVYFNWVQWIGAENITIDIPTILQHVQNHEEN